MDLAAFMEHIGARLHDVADATGLDISTVSRIKSGVTRHPRADALLKIQAWADAEAKRLHLKRSHHLDFDYLRDVPRLSEEPAA